MESIVSLAAVTFCEMEEEVSIVTWTPATADDLEQTFQSQISAWEQIVGEGISALVFHGWEISALEQTVALEAVNLFLGLVTDVLVVNLFLDRVTAFQKSLPCHVV